MTLGQYVRAWRSDQRPRLTIKGLVERMIATGHTTGVTEAWISLLENDKLNVAGIGNDKLRALGAVLGVSVDDLLLAAGLGGVRPADELGPLLARLHMPEQMAAAITQDYQQMNAGDQAALIQQVHQWIARLEQQPVTRQQPAGVQQQEPGVDARQAGAQGGADIEYAPDHWAAPNGGAVLARVNERARGVSERGGLMYLCGE